MHNNKLKKKEVVQNLKIINNKRYKSSNVNWI